MICKQTDTHKMVFFLALLTSLLLTYILGETLGKMYPWVYGPQERFGVLQGFTSARSRRWMGRRRGQWEHWEGKTINFLTQMISADAAWELGSSKSPL